ncbi:MAG: 50S ribosomal protein L15 [bacterium]
MKLHTMTNTPGARSTPKRFGRGRGSGLGKTSGRGHKGQYARSGHKYRAAFEGGQMPLIRRLPKRGFTNVLRRTWAPVNLSSLNMFSEGTTVTPGLLVEKGLARGKMDGVKILGKGVLKTKLTVQAHAFSAAAKAAIEAIGGTCETIIAGHPKG